MDSLWSDLTETITQSIDQASKVLGEVNQYDILNFDEMQEMQEKEHLEEVNGSYDDDGVDFVDNSLTTKEEFITTTLMHHNSEAINLDNSRNHAAVLNHREVSEVNAALHAKSVDTVLGDEEEMKKVSSMKIITAQVDRHIDSADTSQLKSLPPKQSRKAKKNKNKKKKQLDFFGLAEAIPEEDSHRDKSDDKASILSDNHPVVASNLLFSDILSHVSEGQSMLDHEEVAGASQTHKTDHVDTGTGQELLQTFNNFFNTSTPTPFRTIDHVQSNINEQKISMNEHLGDFREQSSQHRASLTYGQGLSRYQQVPTSIKYSFFDDLEEVDSPVSDPSRLLKQIDLDRILYPQLHLLPSPSLTQNPVSDVSTHTIEIKNTSKSSNDDSELHLHNDNHDWTHSFFTVISVSFSIILFTLVSLSSGLWDIYNFIRVSKFQSDII